ncbi:hypothetical protein HDV00_007191 [Rhizophlyctis rosea]|nr:hypothetical protein HDV00_007191 [Rhizophlyctis rosea]
MHFLPPEFFPLIAERCDAPTGCKLRSSCRGTRSLIKIQTLILKEAQWRYHINGVKDCWEWAVRHRLWEFIESYVGEVGLETVLSVFDTALDGRDIPMLEVLAERGMTGTTSRASALSKIARMGHLDLLKLYSRFCPIAGIIADIIIPDVVFGGDLPSLKFILDQINDIRNMDDGLDTACRLGNPSKVKVLLEAGADIHIAEDDCLGVAAEHGHIEVVKVLLAAGADVQAGNEKALVTAAMSNHISIVELLLEAGADVNAINAQALRLGFDTTLQIVNALLGPPFGSPLVGAAMKGHEEVVRVLLRAWVGVDALRWAAVIAAVKCQTQVVKVLVESCPTIREDPNFLTAVTLGPLDAMRWLVKCTGRFKRRQGRALVAAARGGSANIVEITLEGGANVHFDGDEALVVAAREGHTEVVQILLGAGANVNARRDEALLLAAGHGHTETVKVLVNGGAAIHAINNK